MTGYVGNIPNGGSIVTGQVWSAAQWQLAFQSKLDVTLPPYVQTVAEVTANVTPISYGYATLNVLRYGADPTGATSSASAFTNAIAVANQSGGTVYAPAGTYTGLTAMTITHDGVNIVGDGPNATILSGAGTTGNLFSFTGGQSCGISGLSIQYASTQVSGAAIYLTNVYDFFYERVRITAPYVGVEVVSGTIFWFDAVDIYGAVNAGIIVGISSAAQPIEVFLNRMEISNCGGAGLNLINVDGMYCKQADFIECNVGVSIYPSVSEMVGACYFETVLADTCTSNGWQIVSNGGEVSDINLVNCWSSSNGTAHTSANYENGIWIDQGSGTINGVTISSTRVLGNQGAGIQIDSGTNIDIADCAIECNSQVGAQTRSGIEITAGVSHWSVRGGRIGLSGHYAVYNNTNNQAYAINVAAGSSDYYSIMGVDAQNAGGATTSTGSILDGGTGVHKAVSKNLGYNPIPQKTVTVTASPFTFINETGDTVILQVTGGTVSNIQMGNATWSSTNQSIVVPHNLAAIITYSVAPTIVYYGT
jgi:hypothetical protein